MDNIILELLGEFGSASSGDLFLFASINALIVAATIAYIFYWIVKNNKYKNSKAQYRAWGYFGWTVGIIVGLFYLAVCSSLVERTAYVFDISMLHVLKVILFLGPVLFLLILILIYIVAPEILHPYLSILYYDTNYKFFEIYNIGNTMDLRIEPDLENKAINVNKETLNRFCKKCGKMIHEGSKFCSYCGTNQE